VVNENISFFDSSDAPYGKTYGAWTVDWWKWILGIPKSINPALDNSGACSGINQKDQHVFFLAGKLAEERENIPERSCIIPGNKSILFPIINCESNPLEYPELGTNKDIFERVQSDENTITRKECYVDGNEIVAERVPSDPLTFEIELIKDNLFNANCGITSASADGYWAFLKPLSRGRHTIVFQGSCEYGKLHSGAIYNIDIQ
jgi:hypothetical protein